MRAVSSLALGSLSQVPAFEEERLASLRLMGVMTTSGYILTMGGLLFTHNPSVQLKVKWICCLFCCPSISKVEHGECLPS